MNDFFISYNEADRAWAEWIAWQLEEAGYSISIMPWDFRPGSNFILEMDRAARKSNRIIVILSPNFVNSIFSFPEWEAAFLKDLEGKRKSLLPVRVKECQVDGLLRATAYIDLVGLEADMAKGAILAGAKQERAKPSQAPTFPGTAKRIIEIAPRFPEALPPVWNVPFHRNPQFTGREKILAVLHAALVSNQPSNWKQALSGMGGVGKTQIAIEYAYRHKKDYQLVWWLRSDEPTTLFGDFAALAGELNLPERNLRDQTAIIDAVKYWLGHNFDWLLIFDNAQNPDDIQNLMPGYGGGHIIITSRNPNWQGIAGHLTVKELERPESIVYLCNRTGQRDQEAANILAETLGDLPLALEQAAAYVNKTGRSLAEYQEILIKYSIKLFDREQPIDYPSTVATTWEISFQKVELESPLGSELLNLCTFLAPNDIPITLLKKVARYLPETLVSAIKDPMEFDDAIATIVNYGLIQAFHDSISVNRLVQAVWKNRLTKETKEKWAEAAVCLINDVFPLDVSEVNNWPECSRILPHGLAALEYAEDIGVAKETAIRLMNQIGLYLKERAEFVMAKSLLERALASSERLYGPNHPIYAELINNLGSILWDTGDLKGAKQFLEIALKINERLYGADHPKTANILNNLGNVLLDMGDLVGAKDRLENALRINETVYGHDHPDVAICLNNLGNALTMLGELDSARALNERALDIDERIYGLDHPIVANDILNLGKILLKLGDRQNARKCFEQALKINEVAYGPTHPAVAKVANYLAMVLQDMGELDQSKRLLERAIMIDEAIFGPNHPNLALDLNNLGRVLLDQGRVEEAKDCFERAHKIDEIFLGPDHPITKRALDDILQLNGRS
jgi:tetratricopeptide (TPR) repeat protein